MTTPLPDELAANSVFLRRVAERLLASPDLADDAAQETILVSLRCPPAPTVGSRAWLVGVLRNVARNLRRGERRRAGHERRDSSLRPTTSAESIRAREATRRQLIEAVLTLPETLREVILLRYDEGLPPREVARRTGAPVSTVHDRLRQAVVALRERLELEPSDAVPEGTTPSRRLALVAFATSLPRAAGGALAVGGVLVGKKLALGLAALLVLGVGVTVAVLPRAERVPDGPGSETALTAAPRESEKDAGPRLEGLARPPALAASPRRDALLFGRVFANGTGAPVPQAKVLAFSFEGLSLLAERVTDASGAFALAETKNRAGAFHLVVRHPDFAPHVEAVAQARLDGLSITLAPPSWIVGRLVFPEGEAAPASARVRALARARPLFGGSSHVLGLELAQVLPGEVRAAADIAVAGDGAFRLGPLGAGTYSVVYLAEGRPPLEISGAKSYDPHTGVAVPRGGTVDLGPILLPKTRKVVVRVVDAENDAPVLDARFEGVNEVDRGAATTTLAATATGAPGEYALVTWQDPVTLDLGTMRVTAPGYGVGGPAYFANHVEGPPVARLSRTARVEGEVRGDAGEPLPGVLVLARLVVDGGVLAATTTDAAGRFAFEALPSWERVDVVVVERAARSVLAVAPVELEPGKTLRVTLGGIDGTCVVGVLRESDAPVAGALVSLDDPSGRRVQIQTGSDGRFAFAGLRPGRHELAVSLAASLGFVERALDVKEGQTTDASLHLRHRLAGRLEVRTLTGERAELGALSEDVEIRAVKAEPNDDVHVDVRIRADGTFTFLLPDAKSWTLDVTGDVALMLEPLTITVPRPVDAPPVTLTAILDPRDGTIALKVLDAESGALLPDATYDGRHGTWTSTGTIGDDAVVHLAGAGLGRYEYAMGEDEHVTVAVAFELTPTVRSVVREIRLPRANAVRVTGLTGATNARDAGLQVDDVILRHGDRRVENLPQLRAAVDATRPADRVRVEGLRNGAPFAMILAGGRLGITATNARVDER